MKKRILIALAVALATSAQAESYENPSDFTNPYKACVLPIGRGLETWFLSRDGSGKYPTFGDVNKIRPKIGNGKNKETSFCIGYNLKNSSIKKQGRMIRISHEETSNLDYELCVWGYYGNYEYFTNSFNPKYPNQNFICLFKQEHFQNHKKDFEIKLDTCDCDCLVIEFVCKEKGFYYFSDIKIKIYKSLKKDGCVLSEKYFNNEYPMYPEEHFTSINKTELYTYVSNNVLYADEPSNVCIYNTCGVIVKKEHNVTTLDLSDLKKGVYIAKVNEKTIKFVK